MWGMEKSKQLKLRCWQMRKLQKILYRIQSEIRYSRSFLGEIFYQIGIEEESPYKDWLLYMSEKADTYDGNSLDTIWRNGIERYLQRLNLSQSGIDNLKSLGNQIGFADVQVQIRFLDLYLNSLENEIKELQEQMVTKVKLYHCLGLMSGLLVSVLLL